VFRRGLRPSGQRGEAEFAVDVVLVDVEQELVEHTVGAFEFQDVIGGHRKAAAPFPESPLETAGSSRVAP